MATNFGTRESITAGRMTQQERKYAGPSTGTASGATSFEETKILDTPTDTRMAGPVGARALALMNNPEDQKQQQDWSAMLRKSHKTDDWWGVENGLA